MTEHEPWREMISDAQRRLLNAACGDLAQLRWYGFKLSKDDWRHFIAATVLGWRMLPGINMGEGPPGFVTLGRSSLELPKEKCTQAIELAFAIGDAPWDYEPTQKTPVRWCDKVLLARGFQPADLAA